MKISIRKAKWTDRIDFTVDGVPYHTNDSGSGLWYGDDYMKQYLGTCDFSLCQKTYSGKRKAIERFFK